MDNEYELRYLPLFYEDMYEKVTYIREKLLNSEAADTLIDAVEEAILERLPNCESFEPYHSMKEREYLYYRIFIDNLPEYVALASKTAEEQQDYFTGPLGNDVFQCSPMPWVTYTHISHTNSGKKDNATPLFDWGKYYEKCGRILIPISIQAHHSFVDGIHIGQFVDALQKFFEEY